MFEKASRKALRYNSIKGQITTEHLWNLPLTSRDNFDLDSVAKAIAQDISKEEQTSFVDTTKTSSDNNLRLDIVKHIIEYKLAQKEANEKRAETIHRRNTIIGILSEKQEEGLRSMSKEELLRELEGTS
jgi:hypothetical protein